MSAAEPLSMPLLMPFDVSPFRHFPGVSLNVFLWYVRTTMFSTLSYLGNWSLDVVNRIV